MTSEREFDALLRIWFDDSAPSGTFPSLLESVVTATAHSHPRPAWLVTLRGGSMPEAGRPGLYRLAPFGVATAIVVAVLIGVALFVRQSPNVGPSPVPGPTQSVTQEPSATNAPNTPAAWSFTGSMSEARFDFTATLLLDGRVLVAGGDRGYYAVPRALASAELYDPVSGTWTATGSMSVGRYRHSATLLPNGKVLVAGGNVSSSAQIGSDCCLASAELYDPVSGTLDCHREHDRRPGRSLSESATQWHGPGGGWRQRPRQWSPAWCRTV